MIAIRPFACSHQQQKITFMLFLFDLLMKGFNKITSTPLQTHTH